MGVSLGEGASTSLIKGGALDKRFVLFSVLVIPHCAVERTGDNRIGYDD
ncbi:hypothetical protein [Micromonospora sp. DT233]